MSERTQCHVCVMDKSAEEIVFNRDGCNFCANARKSLREIEADKYKLPELPELIEEIKRNGGKYDVLIGMSGGVDSSFALYNAVKLGLKVLAFSVDNGWNDPRADENIMRLVEGMGVPFYRYVLDIPKFRDLQSAFIKAGLINLEIPTDHMLVATTYEMASEYGIKTVLSGGNVATESIMPQSWGYNARDLVHIKDVYKKMTGKRLKGLPLCSLLKFNYYKWVKGIKIFYILDYLDYNRAEAINILEEKFGYKNYGEKHCENYFTWWFQNYYLFTKFGIDKRKAHLSSLIVSGQMTRQEALDELGRNPVYPRIGLETRVMEYKKRHHNEFKTDEKLFNFIGKIVKALR